MTLTTKSKLEINLHHISTTNNKSIIKLPILDLLNQKIKLIGVDFDGTLIHCDKTKYGSSWEVILGTCVDEKEVTLIADKYLTKLHNELEISKREKIYEDWVKEDTLRLKGLDANQFIQNYKMPYVLGAKDFFNSMNGTFYKSIISGGINISVEQVAAELNFDDQISTILHLDDSNKFLGTYELPLKLHGKLEYLLNLVNKLNNQKIKDTDNNLYNISPNEICFIGDGINDLGVFKHLYANGGLTIGINPKFDELKKYSTIMVNNYNELMNLSTQQIDYFLEQQKINEDLK